MSLKVDVVEGRCRLRQRMTAAGITFAKVLSAVTFHRNYKGHLLLTFFFFWWVRQEFHAREEEIRDRQERFRRQQEEFARRHGTGQRQRREYDGRWGYNAGLVPPVISIVPHQLTLIPGHNGGSRTGMYSLTRVCSLMRYLDTMAATIQCRAGASKRQCFLALWRPNRGGAGKTADRTHGLRVLGKGAHCQRGAPKP
jgi:hypothetical protein